MEFKMFHVGQLVVSKHGVARITKIEITNEHDPKYGYDVQSVPANCSFVVDMDNGHWSYGFDIKAWEEENV